MWYLVGATHCIELEALLPYRNRTNVSLILDGSETVPGRVVAQSKLYLQQLRRSWGMASKNLGLQ